MRINPKYLSIIERGRENPTLTTLINLSESLGAPLGEIFDLTGEEKPSKIASRILGLVKEANDDQLKLILRLMSVILH